MTDDKITDLIRESEELLRENNIADAVRVSGEALVSADNNWSRKYNAKEERAAEIKMVLEAGVMHCLTLFVAQEWKETLDTAVLLDFQTAVDGVDQTSVAPQLLKLRNMALTAFLNLLERMPGSDDADLREHVGHIMRYLLSLTYASFSVLTSSDMNNLDQSTRTALGRSKETMEFMLQNGVAIESPEVEVCGKQVNPVHPMVILQDLLGRMRALGV